jgi:hypothetical protein
MPAAVFAMGSRGNDSIVARGQGRADPTKPEAPVAKRQQAVRRRWSVGLSACLLAALVLVVLALLLKTNPWFQR